VCTESNWEPAQL